jgi:hypothetical protein
MERAPSCGVPFYRADSQQRIPLMNQPNFNDDDLSDFGTVLGGDESFTFGEFIDEHPDTEMILTDSSTVVIAPRR